MSKPADEAAAVSSPRHVLPKDLANAIKYLGDEELDRLIAAALAEMSRRGRAATIGEAHITDGSGLTNASLTRGQLNAVRAAFKAGSTPTRIARQFGLSQSDVREALASKTFGQR
jgi:hypothetical protein